VNKSQRSGIERNRPKECSRRLGRRDERGSSPFKCGRLALISALELANLADQAVIIAHSAFARTESRGAHAREDYHQRDDKNWLKHTCAWKDEDWNVTFAYRPVHLQVLSNDVQSFPPAVRTH